MGLAETRAFFDRMAPQWDTFCEVRPQVLAAMTAVLQPEPGAHILDIACGTGVLEPNLLLCSPAEIRAIDLSPAMVSLAQRKCMDPRVQFSCTDLFDFQEGGFDCAVLYNAYPHFPDKAALFAHIAGRLRPGGRFLLMHGDGRDVINSCHDGEAKEHANLLLPAREEAARMAPWFSVDALCDTPRLYFISGTVRTDE